MKALIATCLMVFLANTVIGSISEATQKPASTSAIQCPQPESVLEHDLIFTEGPSVVEGKTASTCLQRIIDREKKILDSKDDDRDFLMDYMNSLWKSESESIDLSE